MTKRQEALQQLRVDGWYVLEEVIPASRIDAIRESVEHSTAAHRNPNAPEGIGHVPGFIRFDQSFASYLANSRLMSIVNAMLGDHVRISFTTATINYPGYERGGWHADWPFNQNNAGHIPTPYPDAVMHLTTLWMLSPFKPENGGTVIVPGSHRTTNNPTGNNGVDPHQPHPAKMQVSGEAGSVLIMDSRLWHATAPNRTHQPRTSVVVRYAPWWLNLDVLMPNSIERRRMVNETGINDNEVPPVPAHIYDSLPDRVKPLFRHWVRENERKKGKA